MIEEGLFTDWKFTSAWNSQRNEECSWPSEC